MRRIDELHLEHPFAGSRMLRDFLRLQGIEVGRRHVGTLMRRMSIQALYRKPNTSRTSDASGLPVRAARAGHRTGQPGLGAGHHLHPDGAGAGCTWWRCWTGRVAGCWRTECRSRWRRTSASRPCGGCARWGRQRLSTPTRAASSVAPSSWLRSRAGAMQSMDGKGCWRDNVFIERLWRSVKYEDVYLKAYDGVSAARQSLAAYFEFSTRAGRTRATTGAHRTWSTSTRCRR